MTIAIIGSGNVGGTLAQKWAESGHSIILGVRDVHQFKGQALLHHANISVASVQDAVKAAEVLVLATPALHTIEIVKSLGDTTGKVIIDTMNIVMGRGPEGFKTTTEAILANTQSRDVVKCFNTTGYNNMANPDYGIAVLDMFVAGDSEKGKTTAIQLAKDAGFAECYDIGGNDKFELMEQFAWFWINLAMFRGQGREIGFKLLKRMPK